MLGSGIMGSAMVVESILVRMGASMLESSNGVSSTGSVGTISEMGIRTRGNILQTRCMALECICLETVIVMRELGMKA